MVAPPPLAGGLPCCAVLCCQERGYEARVVPAGPDELSPEPRLAHSACTLYRQGGQDQDANRALMVVYGGRSSPQHPLADTWLLDLCTSTWIPLELASSAHPGARYRHSATALDGHRMLVFGGRAAVGGCAAAPRVIVPAGAHSATVNHTTLPGRGACSTQAGLTMVNDVWILKLLPR